MSDEKSQDVSPELPPELLELMRTSSAPSGTPPREAMWPQIEGRIRSAGQSGRSDPGGWGRHWPLGLAACLVLMVGVALGRNLASPDPIISTGPDRIAARGSMASGAARTAALGHLLSSETLLSFVDAEVARGGLDSELTTRGRTLLRDTRLLLDVLPPDEIRLRTLLEDLELVLAQVAILDSDGLDADRRREEMNLLSNGMRAGGVLSRIQAVLPLMESDRREVGRRVD